MERKKLETKIRLLEDEIIRSKNNRKIEELQKELNYLRRKLQRMDYANAGV